jgi:gluconate 2-dehydrogenase gamma chain
MTPTRRDFLATSGAVVGLALLAPGLCAAATPRAALRVDTDDLADDEVDFAKIVANFLCPSDSVTPDGVACGWAAAMCSLIAGAYGSERPGIGAATRREQFRRGVRLAEAASREKFALGLTEIGPDETRALLCDLSAGRVRAGGNSLRSWFRDVVEPLAVRSALSAPVYNRYGGRVFWKAFG